jgi:hypothetical protein
MFDVSFDVFIIDVIDIVYYWCYYWWYYWCY